MDSSDLIRTLPRSVREAKEHDLLSALDVLFQSSDLDPTGQKGALILSELDRRKVAKLSRLSLWIAGGALLVAMAQMGVLLYYTLTPSSGSDAYSDSSSSCGPYSDEDEEAPKLPTDT